MREEQAATFTPGPWTATAEKRNRWEGPVQTVTIYGDKHLIAMYSTEYVEYPSDEENTANARLIAAAPDLLASLQEWIEDPFTTQTKARAAIARATGRSE